MATYRLSGPAEADLLNIWLFIAENNLGAADRQLDTIVETMLLLAENPMMGRSRNELGNNLRSIPVGNYLVIHRPIEDGIEVVRILHGARDLTALFGEESPR